MKENIPIELEENTAHFLRAPRTLFHRLEQLPPDFLTMSFLTNSCRLLCCSSTHNLSCCPLR